MTFLNLQKSCMQKFIPKTQLPKLPLLNFCVKVLTERKGEQFYLCKANLSLDEVKKSINSQTNNKSTCNDGLTAEFY